MYYIYYKMQSPFPLEYRNPGEHSSQSSDVKISQAVSQCLIFFRQCMVLWLQCIDIDSMGSTI